MGMMGAILLISQEILKPSYKLQFCSQLCQESSLICILIHSLQPWKFTSWWTSNVSFHMVIKQVQALLQLS